MKITRVLLLCSTLLSLICHSGTKVPLYTTNRNGKEELKKYRLQVEKATSIFSKIRTDRGFAKALAYTYFKDPVAFAKSEIAKTILGYHLSQFACLGGVCESFSDSIEEALKGNDILLDIFKTGKAITGLKGVLVGEEIEPAKLLEQIAQVTTGDQAIEALVGQEIGTHLKQSMNYYMEAPGTPVSSGEFQKQRVHRLLLMTLAMEAIEGMDPKGRSKSVFQEALTLQLADHLIPLSRQLSGLGQHPSSGYHYFDAVNGIGHALAATTNSRDYMYRATRRVLFRDASSFKENDLGFSELMDTQGALESARMKSASGENPRLDRWIRTGHMMAAVPIEMGGGALSIPAHILNSMIHLADAMSDSPASKSIQSTLVNARGAVAAVSQNATKGLRGAVELLARGCNWLFMPAE